ncbi:hypothetical protein G6355_19450 [Vibrio cholerae]|nr:hypothetical protein [Vibrio cholerae]EGQ8494449.1 hypothetical protein [Vibrio cholerae]EGR0366628.1 hypothetical protein [Vibrio cholerae]EGR0420708.1 hypothetical protein [Vibrio cholerae]EGR0495370.1 hypothetical protein [Vibrio cholerae]
MALYVCLFDAFA